MILSDFLQALLVLVVLAAVGRVVLALLPVGAIGGHGVGELPVTWAASHLLGAATFALFTRLEQQFELGHAWRSGWTFVAPWLVVAAVRCASLPGALVPRHEPRGARLHWGVVALGALAMGFVVASWCIDQDLTRSPQPSGFTNCMPRESLAEGVSGHFCGRSSPFVTSSFEAAALLALLVLGAHALRVARRAPLARGLALLWLAWLVFLERELVRYQDTLFQMLAFGGGAAVSVAWFRRGDRRALALSAIALASAVCFEPWAWASSLACLVVLVVASPRAAWKSAAAWSGIGLVPVLLTVGDLIRNDAVPPFHWANAPQLIGFLLPAFGVGASAYALRVLVLRKPNALERIDSTVRESVAVGAMLLVGSVAALEMLDDRWSVFAEGQPHMPGALLPFLGLVPLLVALVGAPDERTLPPA